MCRRAGFRKIVLRGDTAFSQSERLDAWDADGVTFYFGFKAMPNLEEIADNLPKTAWKKLLRAAALRGANRAAAEARQRQAADRPPPRVRGPAVARRGRTPSSSITPTECQQPYRMIVLRKNISHEKGEMRLFDEIRYFFYITNDWAIDAEEVVFEANDRCNQENLIAQLAGGVRALSAPVDNL